MFQALRSLSSAVLAEVWDGRGGDGLCLGLTVSEGLSLMARII